MLSPFGKLAQSATWPSRARIPPVGLQSCVVLIASSTRLRPEPLSFHLSHPLPLPSPSTFCPPRAHTHFCRRASSSSSSTRWKTRQTNDTFAREAKVAGLKSRAAFKLLEIDHKHRIFRRGDTVVDLGYAPGSWSQVAVNRVGPGGRVVGIDVIPVQPPRGVSTLQGDFLSPAIREQLREYVREPRRGRTRARELGGEGLTAEELEEQSRGVLAMQVDAENKSSMSDLEKDVTQNDDGPDLEQREMVEGRPEERDVQDSERVVNVVLSDMSEPWPLVNSSWLKSVSNPYFRMMNTSGMAFRDHAGSMDLCLAALEFAYDTLVTGGHFLCKFYQGAEDHALEIRLKKLFEKVHRIKPDSSRKESKEAYLVGLRRRRIVSRQEVLGPD